MEIVIGRVHHVQLCVPAGALAKAQEFYEGVLGLKQIPAPDWLKGRGGFWYAMGDGELHIGMDPVMERTKGHPAYEVKNVGAVRAYLEKRGVPTKDEPLIVGRERFSFLDPFGNRIEFFGKSLSWFEEFMAWKVLNRLQQYQPTRSEPYLTDAIKKKISEKYFPRYPRKQAALMPLFHEIMHEYGFIASQAIDEAAEFLGISAAEVQDAVTFYEEFRLEPTGKFVVNVCRSVACELLGHKNILQKIKDVFGVDPGETTEDNMITVFEVECLGTCEFAPAALINEDLHGPLTPEGFVQTLKALPKEIPAHKGNGHH